MNIILASVKWQFALVFLKDIFIFLKMREKHIDYFKQVLTLLHCAQVTLKLMKCSLCMDTNVYMYGHDQLSLTRSSIEMFEGRRTHR